MILLNCDLDYIGSTIKLGMEGLQICYKKSMMLAF